MAKRKRDIQLKVRVTPEERAMIEEHGRISSENGH